MICFRYYWLVFLVTGILIGGSVWAAKLNLRLDTDWLVLFDSKRPEIQALRHWRQQLPGSKDMAVIISGGSVEERKEAAVELGQSFSKEKTLLESPLAALSTDTFIKSGLYFLNEDQLKKINADTELVIKGTSRLNLDSQPNLVELTESMATNLDGSEILARGLEAFVNATEREPTKAGNSELLPVLKPESSELQKYLGDFEKLPKEAFLSLDGGKTLLVLVRPNIGDLNLEAAAPAVARVRELVNHARLKYGSLAFSLTGEPVLVVDERQTIARDSVRGTVASLVLVLILFQFGFKEYLRPSLALASLLVGLFWTLGVVSVSIGHLNFITITYVPILVGIGLDFGIHMAFRYYEHRCQDGPVIALVEALRGAGKDTFFGALTTSAAFAVLWVIGFRGVSELGAIALCGVLLCQLSSCTFLPACLALLERFDKSLPQCGRQELSEVENNLCRYDGILLWGTAVALLVSVVFAPRVGFSVHLLKMQNPKLESVQTELRLVAEGKSSVLTAMVSAPNLKEARRMETQLRKLPTVGEVISLATFLPDVSPEKEKAVRNILKRRSTLLRLLTYISHAPPAKTKEALKVMEEFQDLHLPRPRLKTVDELLQDLKASLDTRGPGPVMDAFEGLREETQTALLDLEPLLLKQDPNPLVPSQLPENLTGRLLLKDGGYVLKIFPDVDIWQPENLKKFLADIRSVSPDVSGEPVLIELFERLVLRTHWLGMGLSLVAMILVLGLILRNVKDVLLAALPTALSLVIVMGMMGLLRWDFNPANFVAVPMLLGIGSVFGLHSVIRMKELGHDKLLSCSTGPAILLSAATSMAGFASLGLADHRGIASLGWLVAFGLLVNAVLSISVLPAWQRFQNGRCPKA